MRFLRSLRARRKSPRRFHADARFNLESLESRVLLSAQISVSGGPSVATIIANGDTTPSKTEHTDMGNVTLNGGITSYTFGINNTGNATLNLAASLANRVVISGANASDFIFDTSSTSPAATVAALGTTNFVIDFNPSAPGLRTATVTITSDDPAKPTYTFSIQGTGVPAPLTGATEDTNFQIPYAMLNAATHEGASPPTPTYQIQSVDSGTLTLNGTPVSGPTLFGTTDTLVWRGAQDANHTLNALTVRQWDPVNLQPTGATIPIRVEVAPVEDNPTGTIGNKSIDANSIPTVINLLTTFRDPDVTGTVVKFDFGTTLGSLYVNLFDQRAPLTVANFLSYSNANTYNNSIIHRSIPGFIEQGGGYLPQYPPSHITTHAPVSNEYGVSNVAGTISMAKVGNDPNSATSEWFFNLANNSTNLDNQNDGFTAFGEVLGNALTTTLHAIAAVTTFSDGGTFSNVPLQNYVGGAITAANFVTLSSVTTVAPLTFSVVSNSNPGLVAPTITNNNLTLTYTAGHSGSANLVVRVTDLAGNHIDSSFSVNVGNSAPVAVNDTVSATPGTPVPINVLANDHDTDGTINATTVVIGSTPPHGTVSVNPTTGVVTYTSAADYAGSDSFTYTVKDDGGATSNVATVNINVTAFTVVVGDGAAKSVTFKDDDGTTATITIKPGKATLTFAGQDLLQVVKPTGVTITGSHIRLVRIDATLTTIASTLIIAGKGGNNAIDVNVITADAPLKAISGKIVNLLSSGGVAVTGSLASLTLRDVTNGVIHIGASLDPTATATLVLGQVTGTDLQSGINIKSLTAGKFSGAGSVLTAPTLGKLILAGDFGGNLNLTGSATVPMTLGGMTAKGAIQAGTWTIAGNSNLITAASTTAGWNPTFTGGNLAGLKVVGDAAGTLTAKTLGSLIAGGNLTGLTLNLLGDSVVTTALGAVSVKGNINGGTWSIGGNANSIAAAAITGAFAAGVSGDVNSFRTTGNATGVFSARSIKAYTVGGSLANATVTLTQPVDPLFPKLVSIGAFTVKGIVDHSTIRSDGNANAIVVGAMNSSNIFGGNTTTTTTITTHTTIKSFKLTGVPAQASGMIASRVAAWFLGTVSTRLAAPGAGDAASGLTAHTITSLTYKDSTGTVTLNTPAAFVGLTSVHDLVITLL